MAVDGLERVEEQQVTPMESNVFSAHVDAGCPLMDEMELMAADAVGDGTQIALAALTRRIVGYAASENAANVIPLMPTSIYCPVLSCKNWLSLQKKE